jgi:hypothetical protein
MPQPALRRLYESLDLQIRYQLVERVLDVQITLTDAIGDPNELAPPDHKVGPASQVCSVPPAGLEPATRAAAPATQSGHPVAGSDAAGF